MFRHFIVRQTLTNNSYLILQKNYTLDDFTYHSFYVFYEVRILYQISMSLKLFIVDDSLIIVERLFSILSEIENVKIVGKAHAASLAIEFIRKTDPDVVVLDIQLPDGNGIDVLKQIKKEKPSTVVIILTNYPEENYRKICLKEGANYFLDKSIDFEKVIDICKDLLKYKNKKMKHINKNEIHLKSTLYL